MNRLTKMSVSLVFAITLSHAVANAQDASDVAKVIVPFVAKHCAHCHGPKKQEGDLALHKFGDEASIIKQRKIWLLVLKQLRTNEMPPAKRPQPELAEVKRFTQAVYGVFSRHDRTAKPTPGRVTMRRLNQVEYANTILDLVGVEIPVGNGLPPDAIGHGFDNLGDFLTLSPLHLERYMALAEKIMKKAIVVGKPPTPPKYSHQALRLLPRVEAGYDGQGRLARGPDSKNIEEQKRLPAGVDGGSRFHFKKGPLQRSEANRVNLAGEYKFVVRIRGYKVGKETPRFALLVDGKEVFKGVCSEDNMFKDYVSPVLKLKPGFVRLGVSLLNEDADPNNPLSKSGIIIQNFSLTGPLMPPKHAELLAAPKELKGDAKSRHVLERFANRAYRRPATKEEIDRLMKLFKYAEQSRWYRLSEQSISKYRKAKLDENVIRKLRHLMGQTDHNEKIKVSQMIMDEEKFFRILHTSHHQNARIDKKKLKAHWETILTGADQMPPPWEASISLVMQAVLSSPKFLFRPEFGSRPAGNDPRPLGDYELASRLSYFLWSTMPDQELFDLAASKQLRQDLPAQVKRMLADPRSQALFDNFAMQWLGLRSLASFNPNRELFPKFSPALRDDMIHETRLFFMAVLRENRSIFDLVDAKFTFLNQRLARHYEIRDTNGNSSRRKVKPVNPPGAPIPGIEGRGLRHNLNPFVRVNLQNTQRGGLLTHASVLSVTSHPGRTSPVKRGKWVLENLLGTPPPPPPPDVPELEQAKEETKKLTSRQQMEQHRKKASCANCHVRMDPIGLGLENFNVLGQFREKDGDAPIDSSGELPSGERFSGPDELKQILKRKRDLISRNLTEKLLIYATGRGLEYYDHRSIEQILDQARKDDFRFHSLLIVIVQSDPFYLLPAKEK